MLIGQAHFFLHQTGNIAGGVSEERGAPAVVGTVLDRPQDELVEAVLLEPVSRRKSAMKFTAARRGDDLREPVQ